MKVTFSNNIFSVTSSYDEKDIPKAAGCRYNPEKKAWWTDKAAVAAKMKEYADPSALAEIEKSEQAIVESRSAAIVENFDIPCPEGKSYFPYQQAGIAYAVARESCLIGDEMGLGKTIQAIGVINATSPESVLVICPSSLKINWKKEMTKWLVKPYRIGIVSGKGDGALNAEIVIINYDILTKNPELLARHWSLVVADEAHYMKNPKSQRAVAVFGDGKKKVAIKADRKILMTGTPITNRPIELFPLVNFLFPATFSSFWGFAKRYCDAKNNGYGWEFSGAKNLDELQDVLRSTGMIRRLKSQVLTELPAKTRQIVSLPSDAVAHLLKKEAAAADGFEDKIAGLEIKLEMSKASDNPEDYANAVANLKKAYSVAFEEMAKIRMELAVVKIPFVCDHVTDILESNGKVVVMCHHREVVDSICAHFGAAAVKLYGGMSDAEKDASVTRFQGDDSVKVFVGSIRAAGVGITLTAAQKTVFAELDWTPANMLQAEDRTHRIGQQGNVLIQQLVFDGSLDSRMAETLVAKMNVIDRALDNQARSNGAVQTAIEKAEANRIRRESEEVMEETISPLKKEGAPTKTPKATVDEKSEFVTSEIRETVHACLKSLSASCDGAHSVDGNGFNKFDTDFGKFLAGQVSLTNRQAVMGAGMVKKYRGQLSGFDVKSVQEFLK